MPDTNVVYIPMEEEFVCDLVRFSEGSLTPSRIGQIAQDQISLLLETTEDVRLNWFGCRKTDYDARYLPELLETNEIRKMGRPMVWKSISVPHGSEVRMSYGGRDHFAAVVDGKIQDGSNRLSPSQWASKIADGTQRNAWRDISIREPGSTRWILASALREKALESLDIELNTQSEG